MLPLSTSVKLPDPTPKEPSVWMVLAVDKKFTLLAAVPLRVPTLRAFDDPSMEPSVSRFRVVAPVRLTAAARVMLAAVIDVPGIIRVTSK